MLAQMRTAAITGTILGACCGMAAEAQSSWGLSSVRGGILEDYNLTGHEPKPALWGAFRRRR